MSDESLKHAVLDAALARAGSEGFTDAVLRKAAGQVGASGDIGRLFPGGIPSLLAFYSRSVDAELEQRLMGLAPMPVRARIRTAVLTRLEILKSHKEAAKRAAAHLSFPANLPLAARLMAETMDIMWRAAGDTSTDFNYYSKRGILAGVYSATLMRWFSTEDEREVQSFLDARIENVMQFEKLKARVRKQVDPFLRRCQPSKG